MVSSGPMGEPLDKMRSRSSQSSRIFATTNRSWEAGTTAEDDENSLCQCQWTSCSVELPIERGYGQVLVNPELSIPPKISTQLAGD